MATTETAAPAQVGVIAVRFDRVYGRITCYPDSASAQTFAAIAGTKTLSPRTLDLVRALGYRIAVAPASVTMLEQYIAGVA